MKTKPVGYGARLVLALVLFLGAAVGAQAAGATRVAIMPFTANAKDDISFLVKGVRDMLATRLAWQDKVVVIESDLVAPVMKKIKPPYNDKKARQVGKELNCQVVVYGSITALGKSVSVDARVVRVDENRPALTSFMQAADLDQVIPRINDFARRINAEIFRRPEAIAALEKEKAAKVRKKAGESGPAPARDELPPNISPLNPLFMRQLTGVESDRYWRSPRIDGNITSLAVDDIDHDGKNELLVLLPHRLRVYRLTGKYFNLIQEIKNGPTGDYLFVDTVDMDGDGYPEVFITNMNNMSLESFVMQWDRGGLRYRKKDLPYYFRAQVKPFGKGKWLLAQKRDAVDAFVGPIYRMKYSGDTYVPDSEVHVNKLANVLNFVLADLNGSGKPMTVLVGPSNDLQVYSSGGERLWISEEMYAATGKYVLQPGSTDITDPGYEDHWQFLPARLVLADLDKDGRQEVVVVRNRDRMGHMLQKMRLYYQGTIFSLAWNGLAMEEMWRTPKISGYISDYTVADVGNVGRPALVMAVGQKVMKGFFDKGVGNIVAFTLKPLKKPHKKNKGL